MGLGELAGLAGILLAILALLNEHDRRIWLAPWKPWRVRVLAAVSAILLAYLVTYPVWEGLDRKILGFPFVAGWLVEYFEKRQWILDAKDWASALALGAGIPALIWTWQSPLRIKAVFQILEERRIASDHIYISGKIRSLLASSWLFRRELKRQSPSFLTDPGLLHHWLENDPDMLRQLLELHAARGNSDFPAAVLNALAERRTKAIDQALWNMYEDKAMQRPEASLFLAMMSPDSFSLWERCSQSFQETLHALMRALPKPINKATRCLRHPSTQKAVTNRESSSLWKRIHKTLSTKNVGKGAWGSDLAFNGKTNLDILDTYAGRLGVSWIWLVRCSSLSSGFKDSSLEGYASSAVSMILKDLEGCSPILTPPLAKADRLLDGNISGVIDPLCKTPGAGVRVAQIVTEWFLDEWIQRIRQAKEGEDRQLTIGSIFQFYRHILSASALDELERQALLTSSINRLCAINLSDSDLRNFDDGLTPDARKSLAPWLESKWYWGSSPKGDERYSERFQILRERYPG